MHAHVNGKFCNLRMHEHMFAGVYVCMCVLVYMLMLHL